jgi:hypothetical protein
VERLSSPGLHAVNSPAATLREPMPNRRPKLEIVAPAASPEEAAAVVAAVERFLRETAPPPAPPEPARNLWQRAALLEGVDREDAGPTAWGDGVPWR